MPLHYMRCWNASADIQYSLLTVHRWCSHGARRRGYFDASNCGPLRGAHRQVWSPNSMQCRCWVRAVPDLFHETPLGYVSMA